MRKFTEVVHGYESEEGVELLRVAESEEGDLLTLVKNIETEEFQLAIKLNDGREGSDIFTDPDKAHSAFNSILEIQ